MLGNVKLQSIIMIGLIVGACFNILSTGNESAPVDVKAAHAAVDNVFSLSQRSDELEQKLVRLELRVAELERFVSEQHVDDTYVIPELSEGTGSGGGSDEHAPDGDAYTEETSVPVDGALSSPASYSASGSCANGSCRTRSGFFRFRRR